MVNLITLDEFYNLTREVFWEHYGHLNLLEIAKLVERPKRWGSRKFLIELSSKCCRVSIGHVGFRHLARAAFGEAYETTEELAERYRKDQILYFQTMVKLKLTPKTLSKF